MNEGAPSAMDLPYMTLECEPTTMDLPYMAYRCEPTTMDLPYMAHGCEPATMDLPYMDIESTSSSNSVGVAITQPRVAGEARYPGYLYNKV